VVVIFALLVWNNYTLRRERAGVAAAAKSARALAVNDHVGSLPIIELTGTRSTLQLDRRTIVAVVDPRCGSCQHLLNGIRAGSGVRVLSMAPLAETIAMAQGNGLSDVTYVLQNSDAARIDPRLQIYPQLFVVERGRVVRTCVSIAECATVAAAGP